jgi:3-dehydroquinate synthase
MDAAYQLHGSPIFIGSLGQGFPAWVRSRKHTSVLVLTDENTARHCLPYFLEKSGLDGIARCFAVPAGESAKTIETCVAIWDEMMAQQLDRRALLVNLGGGVIGDMGGFCAAVWKRGVEFVQVPTTLLSMTDAAIGGKTGIDFQHIKNAIGVFQQPVAVFADPFFLKTLPDAELRSGMAEVLKHALIGDQALYRYLERNVRPLLTSPGDATAWEELLRRSIGVKVEVVAKDPLEKGLRQLLNFGHTFGHALEGFFLEKGSPISHGEAVYIGMCHEAEVAEARGMAHGLSEKVRRVGEQVFPHRDIEASWMPELRGRMLHDKKNVAGRGRMALPGQEPFSLVMLEEGG